MNDFLIELQAKLDETISKKLINEDIATKIQGKINQLQLQATLDEKSLKTITEQLFKISNQKITISNINFNTSQATKAAQQSAKQLTDSFNQAEKELAQQSTTSTDKIIQNEAKKQEAIHKTGKEYQKIANDKSLIRNDSTFKQVFGTASNEAKKAQVHFRELLADEKAIVTVNERFDDSNALQSFVVNIKRANGEIESLRYAMENLEQYTGKANDWHLAYQGGTINDANTIKQFEQLEKKATEYSNKLNDLKSKLTGTDFNFSGFERLLTQFRNGEITVNQLSTAFNQLKNSAETSLKNLNSQSSSFNPITQAANNMRDLPSMLNELQAKMDGVKDKTSLANISVEDLRNDCEELQNVMNNNGGKVPLADDWISKYKTLMSTVVSATKQVETLKKVEASDNSQATKQANYYSTILSNYRQIYSLKQKLLTAGKEETKIIETQMQSLNASNTTIYRQLSQQGLNNKDWQSEVDALKKSLDYSYQIASARQKDKITTKEQTKQIKEQAQVEKERLSLLERQKAILANQAKEKAKSTKQQEINQQKEINIILSKQQSTYKEIWNINKQIATLDPLKNESQITSLNEKKKIQQEIYLSAQKELQAYNNISVSQQHLNSLSEIRKKSESDIAVIVAKQNEVKANKIQLSMETGGYESQIESLIAKTRQWTDEFGNARINTDSLKQALNNLGAASTALSNNNTVANQKALIAAEKNLDIQIKKVTNSIKKKNSEFMKSSSVDNLRQKYQEFYDKNGAAHRRWGTQLKQGILELASGAQISKQRGEELRQELIQIQNAARQAGKLGKSGLQKIFEGFKSFSYWTSSTFIVMKTIQTIKSAVSSVKELDTALVDLKKTTTMTANELEQFYYDANDVAKQMGVTTKEIINQAAEFSRLGYSSKEAATQMAKYSSWFKIISPGMSIEQAGDTLTSVMKAFKYDVQDIEKIMSMINTVGNNFAVSNLDISEILTRSSSAMMEANNSLADTIALGTAATEITRDAASVGMYLPTNIVICC